MKIPVTILCAFAMAVVATSPTIAHEGESAHTNGGTPFGRPGIAKNASRTVTITLTDAMRFEPASLTVERGKTLRFHIVNTGKLPHEFVLGTRDEIAEHAKQMQRMPTMVHNDANAVRVESGKSADLIWQFSVPGTFLYACLVPGHWEAGMQGTVTVAGSAKKP